MAEVVNIRPSESIFMDFTIESGTIPSTLEAAWYIRNNTNTVVATGAATKAGGDTTFEVRITETDTTGLEDGTYDLLVKVSDSVSGYADYIYDTDLKVKDR